MNLKPEQYKGEQPPCLSQKCCQSCPCNYELMIVYDRFSTTTDSKEGPGSEAIICPCPLTLVVNNLQ